MSMWEFYALVDGWLKANRAEDEGLTAAEKDDLWSWISDGPQQTKGQGARRTLH